MESKFQPAFSFMLALCCQCHRNILLFVDFWPMRFPYACIESIPRGILSFDMSMLCLWYVFMLSIKISTSLKKIVWFFILSTRIFGSCLNTETGFRFTWIVSHKIKILNSFPKRSMENESMIILLREYRISLCCCLYK